MRALRETLAIGVMIVAVTGAWAQQPASPAKDPSAATLRGSASDDTSHTWTNEQLMTSTVHEAWVLSGRNEDQFFQMVRTLASMSAEKRGLTLPETDEAGAKAGQMIKRNARKDPDQLLYAVVDAAVKKVGTKSAAGWNGCACNDQMNKSKLFY